MSAGHEPEADPVHYDADPDDPDLNPDVERASEIDDVTGPVPRIEAADVAADGGDEPTGGEGGARTELDPALAAALAERDELRDVAQRVQAEFDNFRKQAQSRTLAEADRATGRLVEALLPVFDAAEAAYVQHPDEVGPLLNAMLGELRKHGLETLDLEGKPFDPEVAESVAHEPGDGGELIVADVLRSGYRWKGRTLRAAMVRTRD